MDKQTRDRAKAVNFGIVYGISPFGLAAQLGIEQNVARLYIETYFARYSGVRRYIDQLLKETRREQRSAPCSAAFAPFPICKAATPTCAALPSAPRSTHRFREQPRT